MKKKSYKFCLYHIFISHTQDSACVFQKMKLKISAVFLMTIGGDHIGCIPLAPQKNTIQFCICELNLLNFSCIKKDLLSPLPTSTKRNIQIVTFRGNRVQQNKLFYRALAGGTSAGDQASVFAYRQCWHAHIYCIRDIYDLLNNK